MMVAAKTLAASAIELYTSPDLLQQVQADFKKIREPLNFLTLIPEGQQAPKAIR